jgi:signal peptidase I
MGTDTPVIAIRRARPELLPLLLQDLAAQGIPGELPVRGASMRPTLLDGDRIWLIPATAEDLRLGDIVVWIDQAKPIIHRCVGWWRTREGWRVLTKGDGVRCLDRPVHSECLVGRVVARVHRGAVERMDDTGTRLRGRGLAAGSLAVGIMAGAWNRGRRAFRRWAG